MSTPKLVLVNEIIKNGKYFGRDYSPNPEIYDRACLDKKPRKYLVDEDLTPNLFWAKFIHAAGLIMRSPGVPFVTDDDNRAILQQLYHYVSGNKKEFAGDIDKGILFVGPYGTGKSLLAMVLMECLKEFWHQEINTLNPNNRKSCKAIFLPARDIFIEEEYYSPAGGGSRIEAYKTRGVLCIDDLGKEPAIVNDFGTKTKPWEDVAAYRYDQNLLTFATSNLKVEDMNYSGHCKSRMAAMMNILTLKGKNRRQ